MCWLVVSWWVEEKEGRTCQRLRLTARRPIDPLPKWMDTTLLLRVSTSPKVFFALAFRVIQTWPSKRRRPAGQCLYTARLLFCLASCLYSSSWVVSTSFFFLDLKKIIIKPRFPWNREFHRSDFPFYLLFFLGAAVHYHTTLSCSYLLSGRKKKKIGRRKS